jgi:hypothetical protein
MKDRTNPLSEFTRVPAGMAPVGEALPKGVMRTEIIDQNMLDEAERAMGRPLWDFEVKILDMICIAQGAANLRLFEMGKPERRHSWDEVLHLFCTVVKDKEMDGMLKRVIHRLQTDNGN